MLIKLFKNHLNSRKHCLPGATEILTHSSFYHRIKKCYVLVNEGLHID